MFVFLFVDKLPIRQAVKNHLADFFEKKVSVLVSKNIGLVKKSRFRFWKKSSGFGKKVSVSENFGLGKKSRFWFLKIWSRKKVSVSVSEKIGLGFGKFGIGKKVLVSVSVKILVSSFSGWHIILFNVSHIIMFNT